MEGVGFLAGGAVVAEEGGEDGEVVVVGGEEEHGVGGGEGGGHGCGLWIGCRGRGGRYRWFLEWGGWVWM